ncbi:MAG: SEL1-like repeat protein [Victivallales bacterium]|nr:SEL1-like repeat protein [Victivallales bacterium]
MISRLPFFRDLYWLSLGLRRVLLRVPHTCEMDLTSRCNLRCSHCYTRQNPGRVPDEYPEVPAAEWERRMRLLHSRGIRRVLFVGGEPALRLDILDIADDIFPVLMVITNGTIRIPTSFRHILFVSIDGDKDTNDAIRGEGVFDKVMENYQGDPRVILNMTLHQYNYKQLEKVVAISLEKKLSGCSCNIFCSSRDNTEDYDKFIPGDTRSRIIDEIRRVAAVFPNQLLLTPSMVSWFEHPDHSGKCQWRENVLHYDADFARRTCFIQNPDCRKCGCYAGAFSSIAYKPIESLSFYSKTRFTSLLTTHARTLTLMIALSFAMSLPSGLTFADTARAEPLESVRNAAENGDARSQVTLGNAYFHGNGVQKDYHKAFSLYSRAAENGSAAAYLNLGICLENGLGTPRDKFRAFDLYSKAAGLGIREAMFNVAMCHKDGIYGADGAELLPPDSKYAEEILSKLIDSGFIPAHTALAAIYIDGKDPERSQEAFRLLSLAAAAGDPQAMSLIADCYSLGLGAEPNETEKIRWLENAAAAGSMEARAKLAFCLEHGNGVAKDTRKALRLYAEAAAAGILMAQVKIAEAYAFGIGVTQDVQLARRWFEKAAAAGSPKAIFSLGIFAMQGIGENPDEAKAANLFLAAARLDDPHAQFNIATCFLNGRGVKQNPEAAFHWFKKAAEANSPKAQRELAFCYFKGTGTETDFEQGMKWLRKAIDNGDTQARNFLDDVMP